MPSQRINDIIKRLDKVSKKVSERFSELNEQQLNRKPSDASWSIAQCLDHLIVTNRSYFPQLNSIIEGNPEYNFWKNVPLLPGFFGKLLKKSVSPDEARKVKTMAPFMPAGSNISGDIVERFVQSQHELADVLSKLANVDLANEKVTSPVSRFITYSIDDLLEITVRHEDRHFDQAVRVAEHFGI